MAVAVTGLAVGVFWLSFFLWTNSTRLSAIATFSTLGSLHLASIAKMKYWNQLLIGTDYYMIQSALANAEIAAQYKVEAAAITLFTLLVLVLVYFSLIRSKVHFSQRKLRRCLAFVTLIGFLCASPKIFSHAAGDTWSGVKMAMPKTLYRERGAILVFFSSLNHLRYEVPNYSTADDRFEKLLEHDSLKTCTLNNKPNVIIALNESTFDPKIIKLPDSLKNLSDFLSRDSNPQFYMPLRVHTYGGGTWRSEFAALSGLNHEDFGPPGDYAPYTIVPNLNLSLAREFQKNGYHTIGLYPINGTFFNARNAYRAYGFDEFLDGKDLGFGDEKWIQITDSIWFNKLEEVLRATQQRVGKPIFVFALTIYNHGPHNTSFEQISSEGQKMDLRSITDKSLRDSLRDYLARFLDTKRAHEKFIASFVMKNPRPTIFASFGDHFPGFLNEQSQITFTNSFQSINTTYLAGWSNFKLPRQPRFPLFDLTHLGSLLLDLSCLNKSQAFKANAVMRETCQGSEDSCNNEALKQSYRKYLYNTLKVVNPM